MDTSREADIARRAREIVVRELEAAATDAYREAHALGSRACGGDGPDERALAEQAKEWAARGDCYQRAADGLKAGIPAQRPAQREPTPTPPAAAAEPAEASLPSDDELLWFLLDKRVATSRDFSARWPKAQLRSIGRRLGELANMGLTYSNSRGYGLTAKGANLAHARGLVAAVDAGAAASPVPPPKGGRAA